MMRRKKKSAGKSKRNRSRVRRLKLNRSHRRIRRSRRLLRLRRMVRLRKRTVIARRRRKRARGNSRMIPSSRYDWLFYAPSVDARMMLNRRVWRRIRQQLPYGYAIPDRGFIKFVRARAGLAGG